MATERQQAALDLFGELPAAQVSAYVATIEHVLGHLTGSPGAAGAG